MRRHALRTVRTWRYWIRYALSGTPSMLARQIWRYLWTFKTYQFSKYKGVRNDIPRRIF
jgi:hypothetical protein